MVWNRVWYGVETVWYGIVWYGVETVWYGIQCGMVWRQYGME